jgi:hypothetical protein
MLGGVMWLTETHATVNEVKRDVQELALMRKDITKIDERLSRIEGQLEILILEILRDKE